MTSSLQMRWFVGVIALAGCDLVFPAKEPPDPSTDAAVGGDAELDGLPPGVFPHLPPTIAVGDIDVRFDVATTVDTTNLQLVPAVMGASISAVSQMSGPGLMVVVGRDITFAAPIKVRGTRAVVFVGRTITVATLVDVGANLDDAGPASQLSGAGVGGPGLVAGSGTSVAGAGGGAFGPGARFGGAASTQTACLPFVDGGVAGTEVADTDLVILEGGASGGVSTRCNTPGGGGGGAIQLSALDLIRVTGTITASGGGGSGGLLCGGLADGGGGGGAGGGIYLDAPMVEIASSGAVTANGGGGGSGGCSSPQQLGNAGADGHADATMAAGGSAILSGCGEQGGSGAFATTPASVGSLVGCTGQAGGGGGSVGHIVLRAIVVTQNGTVSPTARTLAR